MFEEDRTQVACPYCGNSFSYEQSEMHEDGTVSCRGCGSIIETRHLPTASQDPVFSSQSDPTSDPFSAQSQTKKSSGGCCGSAVCPIAIILLILPLIIAIPLSICAGLYYLNKSRN